MRTETSRPSGHSWSRSARCASTAADTASRARGNEKKNASPWVSISVPACAPKVSRTSWRCSPETRPYASSPSSCRSCVEPSMSVKTNVTVPPGKVLIGAYATPMNRLAQETSPYLLQHAGNPVDWQPWGDEAFSQARGRRKPLLVSVGYFPCHWRHVMERESFEDEATAVVMNELFVNVKVDREERPDVDAVYMDAVVALTGQGGWPLTVFLTPDGEPFYGGTYFPPEPRHRLPSFPQLLRAVADPYPERPQAFPPQVGALADLGRQSAKAAQPREPLTEALLAEAER